MDGVRVGKRVIGAQAPVTVGWGNIPTVKGCVYVYPSTVDGYDAVVRMWVTKAEYAAGFDAELYRWVTDWMRRDWPFARIAYPGRTIEWGTWDSLVAADKSRKAASDEMP